MSGEGDDSTVGKTYTFAERCSSCQLLVQSKAIPDYNHLQAASTDTNNTINRITRRDILLIMLDQSRLPIQESLNSKSTRTVYT